MSDNSVVTQNKIGGIRMLVPIKVIGAGDGQRDAGAWKAGAFYGNPLGGFTAAPWTQRYEGARHEFEESRTGLRDAVASVSRRARAR